MLKSERKLMDWLVRQKDLLLFFVITCLAILSRLDGLEFVSNDMKLFLLPWAEQFRANPGFAALKSQIGDYNILYQTVIVLISRLPWSMVTLYKSVSILFDFLLALACAKLICNGQDTPSFYPTFTTAYAVVLFLPTVVLNSAVWGQCDSIYAFFCILALAALYLRHYVSSFIALGLAFALKIQTVFLLPVYLYLYLCRRDFSLLHFFISLSTLWATGIPAYLQGRPLTTVFRIYLRQTNEYPQMVLNTPNIWNFFFPAYSCMHVFAIALTVLILGLFLYHFLRHGLVIREDLESFLIVCAWSAWTCFFFLPAMHERYSYMSDLLLVLLSLLSRKYLPYALAAVCVSGIAYTNYLLAGALASVIPYLTPVGTVAWFLFTFRVLPKSLASADSGVPATL